MTGAAPRTGVVPRRARRVAAVMTHVPSLDCTWIRTQGRYQRLSTAHWRPEPPPRAQCPLQVPQNRAPICSGTHRHPYRDHRAHTERPMSFHNRPWWTSLRMLSVAAGRGKPVQGGSTCKARDLPRLRRFRQPLHESHARICSQLPLHARSVVVSSQPGTHRVHPTSSQPSFRADPSSVLPTGPPRSRLFTQRTHTASDFMRIRWPQPGAKTRGVGTFVRDSCEICSARNSDSGIGWSAWWRRSSRSLGC